MVKIGVERITKKEFYALGGFSNSSLFRKQLGAAWAYFINHRLQKPTKPKTQQGGQNEP